jgi:peroxiredoxin
MGSAKVGKPAPDFTAQTSDGKPFQLSSVLGKKPIAIYFAAFEG